MREILGERRKNRRKNGNGPPPGRSLRGAALGCARSWRWPVLPGVGTERDGRCRCGRPGCAVPGAHPQDPGLLAATADPRMVHWWWTARPSAPILLATGGRAPCAVSLPTEAGRLALAELQRRGMAGGPVVAGPTRWLLLVRPYELPRLGELLSALDRVPSSLRFHGRGGYAPLPPSPTAGGDLAWARAPEVEPRTGRVVLPRIGDLLEVAVRAGLSAPDQDGRLAY